MNAIPRRSNTRNLFASPLRQVIATDQLADRPSRQANPDTEQSAWAELASVIAKDPADAFDRIAEYALLLCKAGSAGVSVLEETSTGPVFRWRGLAGEFAPLHSATLPRDNSPCGVVLDQHAAQLMKNPVRAFPYIGDFKPSIAEVLLVPVEGIDGLVGTVWVVAHDKDRKFDSEDLRLGRVLADFACCAIRLTATPDRPARAESSDLSRFILNNLEPILQEWDSFARTLSVTHGMSPEHLRNDAKRILEFIAADMISGQTEPERRQKSHGLRDQLESAAHDHGLQRFGEGFNLNQMVSEYRALRASVITLWSQSALPGAHVEQLVRFNEAMDQSLAESVQRFTGSVDRARDVFLAVLGHDMRTPLQVVALASRVALDDAKVAGSTRDAMARISRSADRLDSLVRDLFTFAGMQLGGSLPINRESCNVGAICQQVVDELQATTNSPGLQCVQEGDLTLPCDRRAIGQAVANLAGNAIKHGRGAGVTVSTIGNPSHVVVTVHDPGAGIDRTTLERIQHALYGNAWESVHLSKDGASLGLGLYITREVVAAHGGDITVASSNPAGTVFTVRLPRPPPAE